MAFPFPPRHHVHVGHAGTPLRPCMRALSSQRLLQMGAGGFWRRRRHESTFGGEWAASSFTCQVLSVTHSILSQALRTLYFRIRIRNIPQIGASPLCYEHILGRCNIEFSCRPESPTAEPSDRSATAPTRIRDALRRSTATICYAQFHFRRNPLFPRVLDMFLRIHSCPQQGPFGMIRRHSRSDKTGPRLCYNIVLEASA